MLEFARLSLPVNLQFPSYDAGWMDRRAVNSLSLAGRVLFFLFPCFVFLAPFAVSQQAVPRLELSRTVRTWEFLPVVGTRAGLFGNETGRLEAWVYPLKIFRDFHLTFHTGGRALPAESLARTLTVRPESATLIYVGDSFRSKRHYSFRCRNRAR